MAYDRTRAIIAQATANALARENSCQETVIPEAGTAETLAAPFDTMPRDLFNKLDAVSRLDPPIKYPALEGATVTEISNILGRKVRTAGFVSVNHAVFELTGAEVFERIAAFNARATLSDDQTEVLASHVYLNRQEAAASLGITIAGLDRAMTAIQARFGVKNTPQIVRAARQIGYLANLEPKKKRQDYLDSITPTVTLVESDQMPDLTDELIEKVNKLPDRWIKLIDLESQGLSSTAVANRLQLEFSYYTDIKRQLMGRLSTDSMTRVIYLACKAGVISNNEANKLELPYQPRSINERQTEVLNMLAKGHDRRDAASQLGISVHTINEHVKTIYIRYYVNSCEAAVRIAFEQGILE